jgi:hypothetical protein
MFVHCLNESYVIYGRLSNCSGIIRNYQVCIWVLAVVVYVLIQKLPKGTSAKQEHSQYSYLMRFEPEILAIRKRI